MSLQKSVYIERGSTYAVAIDPTTREVIQRGAAPAVSC
jgi:hypothetical protein